MENGLNAKVTSGHGWVLWMPYPPPKQVMVCFWSLDQLRGQAHFVRRDQDQTEPVHRILAEAAQRQLHRALALQRRPCGAVDMAHHQGDLLLGQAVKGSALGQHIPDVLMVLFQPALLLRPAGLAVEQCGPAAAVPAVFEPLRVRELRAVVCQDHREHGPERLFAQRLFQPVQGLHGMSHLLAVQQIGQHQLLLPPEEGLEHFPTLAPLHGIHLHHPLDRIRLQPFLEVLVVVPSLPPLLLDLGVYVQFVLQVEEDIEVELVLAMLSGGARQIGFPISVIRGGFLRRPVHSQEAIAMPTLRGFQFICEAVEQRLHRQGQQLVPLLGEGGDGGGGLAKAVHQLLAQAPTSFLVLY